MMYVIIEIYNTIKESMMYFAIVLEQRIGHLFEDRSKILAITLYIWNYVTNMKKSISLLKFHANKLFITPTME